MNKLRLISSDLGLTGFISVIDVDFKTKEFFVQDSFNIIVEEKDESVLKTGKTKALIKKQMSFKENREIIEFHKNHNYCEWSSFGLFEQITHRPFQSALSSMSLTDTSAVYRCILESLDIEYSIIPPATWKKALNVSSDKKTSKDLFDKLVESGEIKIHDDLKSLKKKVKNHNQIESVLIAYFYFKNN